VVNERVAELRGPATHRVTDQFHEALAALEAAACDVDPGDVPALLGELERVRARLWTRLITVTPEPNGALPAYTLQEAAGLLHKSPAWVRRRAVAGRIPGARKIGRSWQFARTLFDRARERGIGG
jgi:hypothetical protein